MKITSCFNFIKIFFLKVIAFFKQKDVITFLFFLIFSFVLWYMNTSSDDEVEKTYTVYTKYVGIPKNIYLEEKLPAQIKYTLKGKRKELNKYNGTDSITINLSSYLTSEDSKIINKIDISFLEIIKNYIAKSTSELIPTETQPLSFSSPFKVLDTKEIPVKLRNSINVEYQYILEDSIRISPQYITLLGPAQALDTIEYVYTQPILGTYNKSKSIKTELSIPDPFVINTNNNVIVSFNIGKSTEKEFNIPITLTNVPENINIRTFPPSIDLKFSVSIHNYHNILPSMFDVTIDYKDIESSKISKTTQKVNVSYKGDIFITNINYSPIEVEYVIETK